MWQCNNFCGANWGLIAFGFYSLYHLLLWIVAFGLIVTLVRRSPGWHNYVHGHRDHHDPLDYLKERYAKGEINKDEFDRISHDLQEK